MRTLGAISAAILLGALQPAYAAPLRVESGEHGAFTRFVFPWPDQAGWRAEWDGEELRIILDDHADGFDTGAAFKLIRRNRVSDLVAQPSQLTFAIGCDCEASAFANGNGYLVVDIADPGRSVMPVLAQTQTQTAEQPTADPEPVSPPPIFDAAPLPRPAPPVPELSPEERRALAAQLQDPFAASVRAERQVAVLDELRIRLAEEIGTATTRGVLTSSEGGIVTEQYPTPITTSEAAPPNEPLAETRAAERQPTANLRITTSRDVPQKSNPADALSISAGIVCPAHDVAAVPTWGTSAPFGEQISAHRNALFGEFDRINRDVAVQMAKTYVYFGFGAEATQLMLIAEADVEEAEFVPEIAEILEHGRLHMPSGLGALTDCDSDVALWAIMSQDRIERHAMVNAPAALRALNKLPIHLRTFIAPALSERFLAFGDSKSAGAALRTIERTAETLSPSGTLAQAKIAADKGQADTAARKLSTVIASNAQPSPEALVTQVRDQLAREQPISHETALLVDAYVHELRNSPVGAELRKLQVLAYAKSGQFDSAFEALAALDIAGPDVLALRSDLMAELARTASDIVFLDHGFRQSRTQIENLDPDTNLLIAERLTDLGFADVAQNHILEVPDRPVDPRRQQVAARIALVLGQPTQARALLIGLEDPASELLRAEADIQAGRLDEAAEIYARTDQRDTAIETAWLADDWRTLTPSDAPVFGAVASIGAVPEIRPETAEGILARTTDALSESASARETLDALLRSPIVQIDGADGTENANR